MWMAERGREVQRDKAKDRRALVAQYILEPGRQVLSVSNTSQAANVKGTMSGDVGTNRICLRKPCPKQPDIDGPRFRIQSRCGEQVALSSHCCNASPAKITWENAPQYGGSWGHVSCLTALACSA